MASVYQLMVRKAQCEVDKKQVLFGHAKYKYNRIASIPATVSFENSSGEIESLPVPVNDDLENAKVVMLLAAQDLLIAQADLELAQMSKSSP